jgi:hypothetical protein
MRKALLFVLCGVAVGFLGVSVALAATEPTVTTFTASPATVNSGYGSTLSWNIMNGENGTITFSGCDSGVTIDDNGTTALSCGSALSVSGVNSSEPFTFYNVSGTGKSITASFVPQDAYGTLYPDRTVTTSIYINAASQTITDFSSSNPTVTSGGTVTLNWTGNGIPGVNLQFDCNPNLTIVDNGTTLQCGTLAYSTQLAGSGSETLTVTNSSYGATDLVAHVIPAIDSSSYDATHSKSIDIPVVPPTTANLVPAINSVTASANTVATGKSVDLVWTSTSTPGVNLQLACVSNVVVSTIVNNATTTLQCYSPAFSTPLAANGTTTLILTNVGISQQTLPITIVPQSAQGAIGTASKTVAITILAPGAQAPVQNSSTNSGTGSTSGTPHTPITLGLDVGATNSQVSLLQAFLAKDASIYPEGRVTGHFGPLTQAAVEKFQLRYGLAKVGDAAYGYVGPKTRAKINSLTTP